MANVPTYGYNPEWSADTAALGLRLARQYCREPQVVGQRVVNHEILGLTSEKPDYMVFIRCAEYFPDDLGAQPERLKKNGRSGDYSVFRRGAQP